MFSKQQEPSVFLLGRRGGEGLFFAALPIIGINSPGNDRDKADKNEVSENKFNGYRGNGNIRPGANQHQDGNRKQQKHSDLLTNFTGWFSVGFHYRAFGEVKLEL